MCEFVNRERGSPKNTLTSNIHLQDGNDIVSSPSRTCNIFNKTFIETVNKLILYKNLLHPQISNNNISIKDSLVLLEITETKFIKVIQGMKNKNSAGLDDISPYLLKNVHLT